MGTFGIPESIPTKYTGPDSAIIPLRSMPRRPTTNDRKYPIGQFAILKKNPMTGVEGELWYISKFDGNGDPIWLPLSSGSAGPTISLSDTAGTLVYPTALGNIQIEGTAGQVTVTSTPASNKLTISLASGGTSIDRINGDTGSIVPNAMGEVTIEGDATQGVSTSGDSAQTMTITVANATETQKGVVELATQVESEYNTYGTTQVLQAQYIDSMFAKPAPIGSTTRNTGDFTTLTALSNSLPTGQITATTAGVNAQDTPLQINLRSSGTPLAGFGCTVGLYADNSTNTLTDQINLSGIWDTPTAGAEVAHAQIQVRSGGIQNAVVNFYLGRLEMAATSDRIRFGTGGVDMMSGSGDPNGAVTAAKGSFYLRIDGSSTSTRAYINTDGAMAWTAVTTAT